MWTARNASSTMLNRLESSKARWVRAAAWCSAVVVVMFFGTCCAAQAKPKPADDHATPLTTTGAEAGESAGKITTAAGVIKVEAAKTETAYPPTRDSMTRINGLAEVVISEARNIAGPMLRKIAVLAEGIKQQEAELTEARKTIATQDATIKRQDATIKSGAARLIAVTGWWAFAGMIALAAAGGFCLYLKATKIAMLLFCGSAGCGLVMAGSMAVTRFRDTIEKLGLVLIIGVAVAILAAAAVGVWMAVRYFRSSRDLVDMGQEIKAAIDEIPTRYADLPLDELAKALRERIFGNAESAVANATQSKTTKAVVAMLRGKKT